MTTRHLELQEEVYNKLQKAAEIEGVSLEQWIEARLPLSQTGEVRALSEALKGLVGVVDSRTDPPYIPRRSTVGDLIAKTFAKQGIGIRHGNSD